MNINKYIKMDSEALYTYLISDVMNDLENGNCLLDALSKTKRYINDYAFRISIETTRGVVLNICGENAKVLALCTELIERASALHLWKLVSVNWNLLGNAYTALGIYERGVECYHNIIKNEKKNNLVSMSSLAYNNLSVLYTNFGEYFKTYEYCILAIDTLKREGKEQPRYHSKMILYLSNLVRVLCKINKLEDIPPLTQKIDELGIENASPDVIHSYYAAMMNYYFYSSDYEKGKEAYFKTKALIGENNPIHSLASLGNYLELCNHFQLDYDFYLDELLSFQSIKDVDRALLNVQLYKELRKYYKHIDDKKQLEEITDKYIEFLEDDADNVRRRQCESLNIVENLIYNNEDIKEIVSKNTELELIAEEAIKHKNALQDAYAQIEMINELGKKLTSSLNLSEVINAIYENIKAAMPTSIFILMVVEKENEILKTVAYYKDDILQPEFSLNIKNEHGLFAECYQENKIISSADSLYKNFFEEQKITQNNTLIKSAVYMPLHVGNRTIGLFSIQDSESCIYTKKHIEFLKELLPYLSIALNNAVHSWSLEKEIQSHLDTQNKLKNANMKLREISSLDGLTQVSSRRDFDIRMAKLLKKVNEKQLNVTIFMLDIDNFKLYNDNYGHLEGDEALKQVAKVFQINLNKVNGLSARFGGEEFIGACVGLNTEKSEQLANMICRDVYNLNIKHKKVPLGKMTVSIGVAVAKGIDSSKKSHIMKLADTALYKAKNTGKNKVVTKQYTE